TSPPLGVSASSRLCFLLPGRLEPLSHFSPVDDVPPRRHIVRPPVLVLEVVRVLPHIEPEDGNLAVHERAVLVRRAEQLELAAREREPRPAAAEAARGGARQLLFELGEVPESLLDRIGERAARLSAPALAGRRPD